MLTCYSDWRGVGHLNETSPLAPPPWTLTKALYVVLSTFRSGSA